MAGTFVLLAIAAVAVASQVTATAASAYTVTARSDVATVEYYRNDVPVIPPRPVVFHSPSTAQVRLDSLGTSEGLASAPEPGAFVRELPEETAGVTGGQINPPSYPLTVRSSHPTDPEDEIEEGPYRLQAISKQRLSSASATVGLHLDDAASVAESHAEAIVSADDGRPLAEATASLKALSIGDLLHISDVRSRARLVRESDGTWTTETSTTVGAIAVDEVAITVNEDGVAVDDASIVPLDSSAIVEQLQAAGIELRYVPAVEGDGFVASAAIELSLAGQDPSGAEQKAVVTLGRVTVTGAASTPGPALSVERPGGMEETFTHPPSTPAPVAEAGPTGERRASISPPVTDITNREVPDTPLPSPVVAAPEKSTLASGAAPTVPRSSAAYVNVFPVLVLSGIATAVASRLLGVLGVRLRLA